MSNKKQISSKESPIVSEQVLKAYQKKLAPELENIIDAHAKKYETLYASVYAPFDQDVITHIQKVAQEKQALDLAMIIVVGIGGSHLGAAAVHEALNGGLYNELSIGPKLYFVDSSDTQRITDILHIMERELQKDNNVLINVISKSGTTTETIVNFYVLHECLKQYKQDRLQDYIVVTSDEDSLLWEFGKKHNYTCLPIAHNIGGRFSVFTPVGLFPLALVGIDIQMLCEGAQEGYKAAVINDVVSNGVMRTAALAHYYYTHGMRMYNLFLFWQDGKKIGEWFRQLLAESLGKEYDKEGNQVFNGILPLVSIGSSDLHSVAQLYLGGPNTLFTNFIMVTDENNAVTIPHVEGPLAQMLSGKTVHQILSAIAGGTLRAYEKVDRPYIVTEVPKKNPYFIGMLLQGKMIEVLYLGYLCNVNPFDQPHVELYKTQTKRLLCNE